MNIVWAVVLDHNGKAKIIVKEDQKESNQQATNESSFKDQLDARIDKPSETYVYDDFNLPCSSELQKVQDGNENTSKFIELIKHAHNISDQDSDLTLQWLESEDVFRVEQIHNGQKDIHAIMRGGYIRKAQYLSDLSHDQKISLCSLLNKLRSECYRLSSASENFIQTLNETHQRFNQITCLEFDTSNKLHPLIRFVDKHNQLRAIGSNTNKEYFDNNLGQCLGSIATLFRKTRINLETCTHHYGFENELIFDSIVFLLVYTQALIYSVERAGEQYFRPLLTKNRDGNIAFSFNVVIDFINSINKIMDLDIERFINTSRSELSKITQQLSLTTIEEDGTEQEVITEQLTEEHNTMVRKLNCLYVAIQTEKPRFPSSINLLFEMEARQELDMALTLCYCDYVEYLDLSSQSECLKYIQGEKEGNMCEIYNNFTIHNLLGICFLSHPINTLKEQHLVENSTQNFNPQHSIVGYLLDKLNISTYRDHIIPEKLISESKSLLSSLSKYAESAFTEERQHTLTTEHIFSSIQRLKVKCFRINEGNNRVLNF